MAKSRQGMFALLAMSMRMLVDSLQEQLEKAGFVDVRPAHGFAFLRLTPHGATGNELAEYLGITKQAASLMVDFLEEHEYVVRRPHPTDRRGKLIILTNKGWRCIVATEAAFASIEGKWAEILGNEHLEEIRAGLHKLVSASNGEEMPALRPIW